MEHYHSTFRTLGRYPSIAIKTTEIMAFDTTSIEDCVIGMERSLGFVPTVMVTTGGVQMDERGET